MMAPILSRTARSTVYHDCNITVGAITRRVSHWTRWQSSSGSHRYPVQPGSDLPLPNMQFWHFYSDWGSPNKWRKQGAGIMESGGMGTNG
jgi:hypothetical protein